MPRRIMLAKEIINNSLSDAEKELAETLGVSTWEFTKLVMEVLDERSTDFIMSNKDTQVILTGTAT